MRHRDLLRQLKTCRNCQSIWIASAIVSALVLLLHPLLVLTFPPVWYAVFHTLPVQPWTPKSTSDAQSIFNRYGQDG